MTAEQVLARMAAVYAGCRSYRDTGVVHTRYLGQPGLLESEEDRPFRTAFVRPDRFRFEFANHFPGRPEMLRYIVHAAGDVVQAWWDLRPGIERPPSLGRAVAAATGVSGGAAHTVPALLMAEVVGGRRLTDLTELARLDDGELDGVACYRLRGRPPAPAGPAAEVARRVFRERTGVEPPTAFEPVDLWIDRRTLLLRRLDHRQRLSDGDSVQVTTYEPEVDVPVPAEELAFDPRAGSPRWKPPVR